MRKIHLIAVMAFLFLANTAFCQQYAPAWTGYWATSNGDMLYISPDKKDKNATGNPKFHYVGYFWLKGDDDPWLLFFDDNLNWVGIHEGGGQWRYDSRAKTLSGEGFFLRRDSRYNERLDKKMAAYTAEKEAARVAAVRKIAQNPWIVGRWKAESAWELVVNNDGTAEIRWQGSSQAGVRDFSIISDRVASIDQEPGFSECIINWARQTVTYSEMGDETPMRKVDAGSRSNVSSVPGTYPEGSTRRLTHQDLSGKSKWQLKIMRNEIYARHNYIFSTQEMKDYFSRQSWYQGKYSDGSAVYRTFSEIEKANVEMIKRYE